MRLKRPTSSNIFLIFIGVVTLFAGYVLLVFSLTENPHSDIACTQCHATSSGEKVVGLNAPVTIVCKRCHSDLFETGYLHPFDVIPKDVRIPRDFPLSSHGELTCVTCHDIHMEPGADLVLNKSLLRRNEEGPQFCAICHGSIITTGKVTHAQALGQAHLRPQYVVTNPGVDIDPLSKECISCHDGSYATSATIMAGAWTHSSGDIGAGPGNHPIGVDYEAARTRLGRKTDLRPMAEVDPRIRFFDGKVGCGSCHDPYKPDHSEKDLVMSNYQSRLCFGCHAIDN